MSQVMIALGSNWQQALHIAWASQRLSAILSDIRFSRLLWTEDIHGTGIFYMNCLAVGTTTLSPEALQQVLKAVEADLGRSGSHVTIDLDLMQYDRQRYHERDWPRSYIQRLIPDIL
jgi:2-amino-4-hydroxy-6-hydroxymethyldihydropteridine diphosphokinase